MIMGRYVTGLALLRFSVYNRPAVHLVSHKIPLN